MDSKLMIYYACYTCIITVDSKIFVYWIDCEGNDYNISENFDSIFFLCMCMCVCNFFM